MCLAIAPCSRLGVLSREPGDDMFLPVLSLLLEIFNERSVLSFGVLFFIAKTLPVIEVRRQ
ncbi:unnamed protein product [Gongylonema pulchrum]|uniref:Secreted protein n=1 Tax=Gongylonema pulchrum TaxID=637853 RepID=A0A183EZH8_9BILA|nr:unnamed protein product [Gongylonema pulchrum]